VGDSEPVLTPQPDGTPQPELTPADLAPAYTQFRVTERILLTGHSHQAWPDVAFQAQQQAWLDAAEYVDGKWDSAEQKATVLRSWLGSRMDDTAGLIALGQNTHELVVRFLSALDLRARPRVVTTDGEFHSIRRQLDRLAEEGLEVHRVSALPAEGLAERLMQAVDDRTAAVLVSKVLFQNAHVVPGLGRVMEACSTVGAELLVDAYHALNAVPFSIREEGLSDAFVVGGGYKYLQMGEGACFLRFPEHCQHRPVVTGWFSEFAELAAPQSGSEVPYGGGEARYAGSTYDPTSHYRAVAVAEFFDSRGLSVDALRHSGRRQIDRLATAFDGLDLDPRVIDRDRSVPLDEVGGFLALDTPIAGELSSQLKERGVSTDFRSEVLRLGPAPYVSDLQLDDAISALGELVSSRS
jgi:kynureninase